MSVPRSDEKPSTNATRPPGEIRGACSCHFGVCTRSTERPSRSIRPSQASYQALSEGSSLQTAATFPPAQPSSKTLTLSGVTSRVSPVAASTSQSRRQNFAGRKTFGSCASAPASSILVAESAPARSAPRSAASTSSRAPSGDQWMSSTEPGISPSSRSSTRSDRRPSCPRSEAKASRDPSGEKRGSEPSSPGSTSPSTSPVQSRVSIGLPCSRNEAETANAIREPSAESATSEGRRSFNTSSGVSASMRGDAKRQEEAGRPASSSSRSVDREVGAHRADLHLVLAAFHGARAAAVDVADGDGEQGDRERDVHGRGLAGARARFSPSPRAAAAARAPCLPADARRRVRPPFRRGCRYSRP